MSIALEPEAMDKISSFSEESVGWRDKASMSMVKFISFFMVLIAGTLVSTFYVGLLWETVDL